MRPLYRYIRPQGRNSFFWLLFQCQNRGACSPYFSLGISLEEGYINLNGILSSTRSYGQGERLVTARKQFEDEAYSVGNPQENVIYFNEDKSWEREIDDFVDYIQNNKKVVIGSSYDAMKVTELVHRIYKADSIWIDKI